MSTFESHQIHYTQEQQIIALTSSCQYKDGIFQTQENLCSLKSNVIFGGNSSNTTINAANYHLKVVDVEIPTPNALVQPKELSFVVCGGAVTIPPHAYYTVCNTSTGQRISTSLPPSHNPITQVHGSEDTPNKFIFRTMYPHMLDVFFSTHFDFYKRMYLVNTGRLQECCIASMFMETLNEYEFSVYIHDTSLEDLRKNIEADAMALVCQPYSYPHEICHYLNESLKAACQSLKKSFQNVSDCQLEFRFNKETGVMEIHNKQATQTSLLFAPAGQNTLFQDLGFKELTHSCTINQFNNPLRAVMGYKASHPFIPNTNIRLTYDTPSFVTRCLQSTLDEQNINIFKPSEVMVVQVADYPIYLRMSQLTHLKTKLDIFQYLNQLLMKYDIRFITKSLTTTTQRIELMYIHQESSTSSSSHSVYIQIPEDAFNTWLGLSSASMFINVRQKYQSHLVSDVSSFTQPIQVQNPICFGLIQQRLSIGRTSSCQLGFTSIEADRKTEHVYKIRCSLEEIRNLTPRTLLYMTLDTSVLNTLDSSSSSSSSSPLSDLLSSSLTLDSDFQPKDPTSMTSKYTDPTKLVTIPILVKEVNYEESYFTVYYATTFSSSHHHLHPIHLNMTGLVQYIMKAQEENYYVHFLSSTPRVLYMLGLSPQRKYLSLKGSCTWSSAIREISFEYPRYVFILLEEYTGATGITTDEKQISGLVAQIKLSENNLSYNKIVHNPGFKFIQGKTDIYQFKVVFADSTNVFYAQQTFPLWNMTIQIIKEMKLLN